jgi:Tfp pilus assembly protein PilN
MIAVNLLPPRLVHRQATQRRLSLWLTIWLGAAGILLVPLFLYVSADRAETTLSARRAAAEKEITGLRVQLAAGATEADRLRTAISRVEALRAKRGWSGLLTQIGECMPDEVWLLSATTDAPALSRPSPAAAPTGTPEGATKSAAQGPGVVRMAGPTQLTLQGYALEHNNLYAFMARLLETRAFKSVELIRSGQEPILAGTAVRFDLLCSW